MSGTRCPVCGRERDDTLANSIYDGTNWFCSPSHQLDFEGRTRPADGRHGRTGIVVLGLLVLAAVGMLAWAFFGPKPHHDNGAMPSQVAAEIANALDGSLGKLRHPIHLRAPLTAEAATVSDAYMRAAYVTHDCSTLLRLSTPGRLSRSDCQTEINLNKAFHDFLVAGSRVVNHNCTNTLLDPGQETATGCFTYTLTARNVELDNQDGTVQISSAHGCEDQLITVWPRLVQGRWTVFDEYQKADSTHRCSHKDATLWERRIAYRR